MAISEELLKILVCPESKAPLSLASKSVIESLNRGILERTVKNQGGAVITEPLKEGLLRQDGKIVYPIRENIPVMLIEEGIAV